jgi:hypothetical protein
MEGIDLETIRRMGGWKSLRMVERYAAVSTGHMDAAVAELRHEIRDRSLFNVGGCTATDWWA